MSKILKNYTLKLCLCLCLCIIVFTPLRAQEPQIVQDVPTSGEAPGEEIPSILVSVLRGDPEQDGGEIEEYPLKNGETAFIKIPHTDIVQSQIEQINKRVDANYETRASQLSGEIAQKITAIQKKQKEYDEEIYPAYRAPLEIQRQTLDKELDAMQSELTKLEYSNRAKLGQQKIETESTAPRQTTAVAGFSVQPVLTADGTVSFGIQSTGMQGANATERKIEAPLGEWVQLMEKGEGQESAVWIRARIIPRVK